MREVPVSQAYQGIAGIVFSNLKGEYPAPKASALPTALIPAIQRSIKNLAAHYFYSTEIWWKVKRKLPEMILMMKIMNAAKVNADTTIAKPSSM